MAAIISDIDDTILRYGRYPIKKTVDYLNEMSRTHTIILITGRSPSQEAQTRAALKAAGLRYNRLYMNGTDMSDNVFKGQKATELKRSGVSITLAIENNPQARAEYRKAGVKAIHPDSLPSSTTKGIRLQDYIR
jgi:hydroxymethylpyrimidine pyrophosphatase-like HAD family hydrolase